MKLHSYSRNIQQKTPAGVYTVDEARAVTNTIFSTL